MMRSVDSFDRLGLQMPTTDRETESILLQPRQAEQFLEIVGGVLEKADHGLNELEANDDLVGSAIVRKCQELADGIGALATQLEQQTLTERQSLAQACRQDSAMVAPMNHPSTTSQQQQQQQQALAQLTEQDWIEAIQGATSFLRDVETSFREVSKPEADEIADVALTLARLFLLSLQSLHATITPEDLVVVGEQPKSSVTIEELSSPEDDDDTTRTPSSSRKKKKSKSFPRVRILWPPLGPAVASAWDWGKEQATQQPLLAVALGLTLWPAAIPTALVGGTMVVVDGCLQNVYHHMENNNSPWIETAEQGAGQLYQLGRLGWLCTQLVTKQTFKIVTRQVDKHGGMGQIACDVGGMAVDRALHPVETVEIAWNGLGWCIGMVHDTVQQIIVPREEKGRVIDELQ